MKETGQICYEAFMKQLAGSAENWAEATSLMPFSGSTWEDLPERLKKAFREAAHQVMQKGWTDASRPPRSWGLGRFQVVDNLHDTLKGVTEHAESFVVSIAKSTSNDACLMTVINDQVLTRPADPAGFVCDILTSFWTSEPVRSFVMCPPV